MRGGGMFAGVRVTVGTIRRFGVIGTALAVLLVAGLPGAAEAARAPRANAAATGSACGRSAAKPASAKTGRAVAADTSPFDIAKWVGEKTAGGAVGAVGGLAFSEVLKLTGLKEKLDGRDPALVELDQIKEQLQGVNERLDLISDQINELTKEFRTEAVNKDLAELCPKMAEVEDLYTNHFVRVVQAGIALGKILTIDPKFADTLIGKLPDQITKDLYPTAVGVNCPDPENPDKDLLVCNTPRELVKLRLDSFKQTYFGYKADLIPGTISSYLTVHTNPASIMTHYGLLLMTSRTLNHGDSVALRDWYNQFAQAEALASWMSMEYASVKTGLGPTPEEVLNAYHRHRSDEEDDLSPMIPQGDVIDLGQKAATSTRFQPIWTLATPNDESFWPINVESNNAVTTTADGASNAVAAVNTSCDPDAPLCFNFTWRIPSTIELKALLSNECQVTGSPPKIPNTCTPFVPSTAYPNVGNYLAKLQRGDADWNQVFCRSSGAPSCVAPADQHTFIWTTDRRSHNTDCGYHIGLLGIHFPVYSRIYSLRAGLPLKFTTTTPFKFTNLNQAWPIYPIMPEQIPGYGAFASDVAHAKCDAYTLKQIPLAPNKGIVLVTSDTGDVEFMAQPASNGLSEGRTAQASLTAVPVRCVRAPFTARIRGRGIKSVRWMVDGRRIAGQSVRRRSRYAASIHVSPGRHTLTVRVKFVASAHTPGRTFHRTVLGCRAATPPFTG